MAMPEVDSSAYSTERICQAAEIEFGTRGFDGTNMRTIAGRAGVSSQLVYRYYEKKEELYREVMARFTRRFYDSLAGIDFDRDDPVAVVSDLADSFVNLFSEYPFTGRLVLDQILHQGEYIRTDRRASAERTRLLAGLSGALARGAERGLFRKQRSTEAVFFIGLVAALGYTTISGITDYIALDVPELRGEADMRRTVADIVLGYIGA